MFFFLYIYILARRRVEEEEIRERKRRDERVVCRKVRETEVGGEGIGRDTT